MTKVNRFVILDDSLEDRFFLKRKILRKYEGSDVLEFVYGKDAVAWLVENGKPSHTIWLVDINMPGENGFEFLEAALEVYPDLGEDNRFFIMSNSIDPEDRLRTEKLPIASSFVSKPLDIEALSELIG